MIKQNQLTDITYKLVPQNMENIFYVYQDSDLPDDGYYYNLLRTVQIPIDLNPNSYNIYVTQQNDTWPLIAYRFYGDVKMWWVITSTNQIINPTIQPVNATQLKILMPQIVRGILNTIKDE